MSMRLPGKIQDLAFLRYPGYVTLLFVNTNIESRTTKNAKMISLSQYPVYPLNNQDTKILCFPLRKKILSNPYNRKGKQHLPHSFTLFSSARVQTFSPLCKMFMNTHDPTMNFHISYEQALSDASTRMAMLAEFKPAGNPSVREE